VDIWWIDGSGWNEWDVLRFVRLMVGLQNEDSKAFEEVKMAPNLNPLMLSQPNV